MANETTSGEELSIVMQMAIVVPEFVNLVKISNNIFFTPDCSKKLVRSVNEKIMLDVYNKHSSFLISPK